jgi:Xaa-Pro aminopeptidase
MLHGSQETPLPKTRRQRDIESPDRIGIDRLDAYGFLPLQEAGLHLVPAQLAIEHARAMKGPDEIELMRRSLRVCDDRGLPARTRTSGPA